MGLWSRIFGTDEAIGATIGAVTKGLDALVYTAEEKAEAAAKDRAAARSMVVDWMKATSGQNLARRWLAMVITMVWLAQYIIAQACAFTAIWVDKPKKFAEAADLMAGYAADMNSAVMLILAFYFAAPQMGQIVDTVMTRWSKGVERRAPPAS